MARTTTTTRQTRRAGRSTVQYHEESSSASAEETQQGNSDSSFLSDSEEWLPGTSKRGKRSQKMNLDGRSPRQKGSKVPDLGRSSTSVWNKKRRYSSAFSSSPDPSITSPIVYEKRRKPKTPGGSQSSSVVASPQKRKTGKQPVRRVTKGMEARNQTQKAVDEKRHSVPPWQTLPYHILLQIFIYAARLSGKEQAPHHTSPHWLIGVSRLCRNFAEPAITALYQTPPLLPPNRARSLLKHLRSPMENMLFNYRNKIQRLDIDVIQTLQYSRPGEGPLDLCSLISLTPRLRHLNLYRTDDGRPYRYVIFGKRWLYSDQLFSVLEATGVRLRSWTWNGRMTGQNMTDSRIRQIHQLTAFQGLTRLAFTFTDTTFASHRTTALALDKSDGADNDATVVEVLLALPNLRHLTFETCSIEGDTLASLPDYLTTLALVNCSFLTSSHLERYLDPRGSQLKELVLKHNESLNLSFLPSLARTCPCLEVLSMDFQFYGSQTYHYDPRPKFKVILLPGEIPTWPSTLHTLELVYLRSWSVETAEMFLQSLIDSAPNLPRLRRLVLKAILQIGWRDRANFRDKWPPRLRNVFLRDTAKSGPTKSVPNKGIEHQSGDGPHPNKKANGHASSSEHRHDDQPTASQNVPPSPPLRRSLRSSRKQPVPIHSDEDSGSDSDDIPLMDKLRFSKSAKSTADATHPAPTRNHETRYRTRAKSEVERLALCAGSDRPALGDPISVSGTNGVPEGTKRGTGRKKKQGKEATADPAPPEEFRQGMCDVVEIRIDNIRPTENQYREEDFLDEELSGDEDWMGHDQFDDKYAW